MSKKVDDVFRKLKMSVNARGMRVSDEKDISYGKQFRIDSSLFRIFESRKKGITLDTSTSKDQTLNNQITALFNQIQGKNVSSPDFNAEKTASAASMELGFNPPLAGSDEVGKGDYFAPLTAACVYLDEREYEILKTLGVRDSKNLTDAKISELAAQIRQVTRNYSIITLTHENYNRIYKSAGNINQILASAHIMAARNTYERHPFEKLLVDRFGQTGRIRSGLFDLNLDIRFLVRAEENIAVAAASIMARDMALKYMKRMEDRYKMKFPLGAGPQADAAGRQFVARYGPDELKNVCKLHFRNTEKILKGI